jgi:hypothetical protein
VLAKRLLSLAMAIVELRLAVADVTELLAVVRFATTNSELVVPELALPA